MNTPSNQKMALITWRAILGVLKQAAEEKDDFILKSDVNQLRGLCDQMDREAFLPLSSNDVSHEFGSRVKQFADLVDTVVSVLVAEHGANVPVQQGRSALDRLLSNVPSRESSIAPAKART